MLSYTMKDSIGDSIEEFVERSMEASGEVYEWGSLSKTKDFFHTSRFCLKKLRYLNHTEESKHESSPLDIQISSVPNHAVIYLVNRYRLL